MNDRVKIEGLGLTATHKRKVRDGRVFDKYFSKPISTDPIINPKATVFNTVEYCEQIVKSTLHQTAQIAKELKRDNQYETLREIFNFFYNHYQYKQDKSGVEQLRTPARAWHDRGNSNSGGIDCDCFSISVSSVLMNLGIPHYFRIVKMYGRDYFQHIYVVVPKVKGANMNIRRNYSVIDPVLDKFDYEAPGITAKHDHAMIPVQVLNGVDTNTPFGLEFNGLGTTMGCTCGDGLKKDAMRRLKLHIVNTRNHIKRHPKAYMPLYKPEVLSGMYDELVGVINNDSRFEAKLEELSRREREAVQPHLRDMSNALHGDDDGLYMTLYGEEDEEMLAGFSGLGVALGRAKRKKKAKNSKKKAGVFTKLKNAAKKIKTAAKKGVQAVKKVAKAVVKHNPVTLAARAGFLVAMRTNFGRLASRVYWGYFSEAEAANKGVTKSYWNKSKQALNKLTDVFVKKLGGKPEVLRKAILNGRAAKRVAKSPMQRTSRVVSTAKKVVSKVKIPGKGVRGIAGLGVVAETTITAALAFLTPLLAVVNKLFKKSNGKEETETGEEMEPTSDDPNEASRLTDSPTVEDDGSEYAANEANNEDIPEAPVEQPVVYNQQAKPAGKDEAPVPYSQQSRPSGKDEYVEEDAEGQEDPVVSEAKSLEEHIEDIKNSKPKKKGNYTGLLIGAGLVAAAGLAYVATRPKNKPSAGVEGVSRAKTKKVKPVKLK